MTRIRKQLAELLMMQLGDIQLSRTGLVIKNRQNAEINYGALADGHRATMSWILDLVGWTYLAFRGLKEPSGIVLIDEIEQHLHPRWQRHILRLLGEQFPDIQFIATSHSALCAAGIYDKKSERFRVGEAHVLRFDDDGNVGHDVLPDMEGVRYDRILSSLAFETPRWPRPLEEALREVQALYKGPKSTKSTELKQAGSQSSERSLKVRSGMG